MYDEDPGARQIRQLEAEIERLRADLLDPAKVWVNMLRGTIARPQALEHYEECKAEIERLRKEADGLIELLRREKAEVERLQTAYRPADMLEYQKVVAEIERLRKVVEAAQDVVKCHSVAGIPHENQSMATVNAERQHTLLRLHAALAALEDDSD